MKRSFQALALTGILLCLGAVPEPAQTYPNTEPPQVITGGSFPSTQNATVGVVIPPKIRPVFDSTHILNAPPNTYYAWNPYPGALAIKTEGGGRFNLNYPNLPLVEDSYFVGGYHGPRLEINEAKLRQFARQLRPGALLNLDIENLDCYWDGTLSDNRVVEENIRQLRRQIRIIREEAPTVQIGVYALTPEEMPYLCVDFEYSIQANNTTQPTFDGISAAYWRSLFPNRLIQFNNWRRATDRMTYGYRDDGTIDWRGGLVDAVNYLAPSIYVVSDVPQDDGDNHSWDIAHDKALIKWMVREAKRIAGDKPVYPYVWRGMQLGPSPNNPTGVMPLVRWDAFMKELADSGVDGVIVWGDMTDAAIQNETMDVAFKYFDRVYPKNVTPTTRP